MVNNRFRYFLPVLGLLGVLSAVPASGAAIQYTDITSWNNATSGVVAVPFTGIAPAGGIVNYNTSTGLVINGVQFLGYLTPASFQLSVVDSQYVAPYWNFGSPNVQSPVYDRAQSATYLPFIRVVLPAGTTAFSTTLGTVSPNALAYSVQLSDGTTFIVPTANRPTPSFIGVNSSSAISYADFTVLGTTYNGGTYGLLQSFKVGTSVDPPPADTPEVATMIMIGVGLLFLRSDKKNPKWFGLVHA